MGITTNFTMNRKSEELKKIQGTTREDRVMVPIAGQAKPPDPQPFLPKAAHKYYDAIMDHLITTKQVRKIDSLTVSVASQYFYMFEKASKSVNKHGMSGAFQVFENGTRQVSPEFTMLNKSDVLSDFKESSRIITLCKRCM